MFKPENDNGFIEYKRDLINMNKNKIEKYASQMRYRVAEGEGLAYYLIGIDDNGEIYGIKSYNKTILNLQKIVHVAKCSVKQITKYYYKNKTFIFCEIKAEFDIKNLFVTLKL